MKNTGKRGEQRIKNLTGGSITPGSGNKNSKGDIILPGWMIEVKSTEKEQFNLEMAWFEKLEANGLGKKDLALVVNFEHISFVYLIDEKNSSEADEWRTKSISPNKLPEYVKTKNSIWKLNDESILKEL